jgi:RNase P/RNase MRP subunit p29
MIAKKSATFEFQKNDKKVALKGSDITYKPENRIKKIR